MITSEQWADMIYSGLEIGVKELGEAVYPIVVTIIVTAIFFNLVINMLERKIYQDYIMSGYSAKNAKKKSKKISKVVEFLSNVNDIINIKN